MAAYLALFQFMGFPQFSNTEWLYAHSLFLTENDPKTTFFGYLHLHSYNQLLKCIIYICLFVFNKCIYTQSITIYLFVLIFHRCMHTYIEDCWKYILFFYLYFLFLSTFMLIQPIAKKIQLLEICTIYLLTFIYINAVIFIKPISPNYL